MALELRDFFLQYPTNNKLIGDDYLFAEYKCPIDVEKIKMWTDTPFLSYVISGKKDWTSIYKKYTINAGEALFFKKGLYNTKQYFEEDFCTIVFFITEDFIKRFMDRNSAIFKQKDIENVEAQIFNVNVTDSLKTLILSIFGYLNQSQIPKELVEIKFNELLYNMVLNSGNKNLLAFFKSLKKEQKTSVETIMLKNFHYDLKIEEYARLCGRSLSTFKRDFQQYFNETPGKWLTNKRLEYAKTLLENSELNVNDICYESGFKNTSHFNSSFKEKYNYPPNQYRKLQLGQ